MTPYFAHPDRLWILLALVPWTIRVARGAWRRDRDWAALAQSGRPGGDGSWSWLAAAGLLILALAQPRWGRLAGQDSPPGHDLVLLVDASRSMGAEDAVPDRMGVAIASGVGLLEALRDDPGNRASVVAFAGRGVIRCPLTGDLDAAIDALRAIRPGDVQPGGTDLGAGLEAALDAFDEEDHDEGRAIVVFSDGEDHAGRWSPPADRLRAEGIVVHSVAIGDPDRDHPVPDLASGPAKDAGPAPRSRRSDVAFEALARATGGVLLPIGLASVDLGPLYRDRIEPTARRRRDDLRLPERVERFPLFVLSALGVGLAGTWPSRSRRRRHRRAWRSGPIVAPAATALLLLGSIGAGEGADPAAARVERGRSEYARGRFAAALDAFEHARSARPDAPIPRYDAASALFQLRRFPEAIARYEEARDGAGPVLGMKIEFALGNARLATGDLASALARYDACLASPAEGEEAEAVRRDAAINRAFVAERIEPPPAPPDPGGQGRGDPGKDQRGRDDGRPRPGDGTSPDRSRRPGGGDPKAQGGPRGSGGAGGEGENDPDPGSPGARLDRALGDVRESRRQRPPDAPAAGPAPGGKDW